MSNELLLVIVTIALAYSFDFVNGFHDAANAIATIVVTKVLTPHQAVIMAATGNFIGAFIFSTAVAQTVGKGIVDPTKITTFIILSGLMGAVIWDLITWRLGLPTSSSHALIGGYIGAVLVSVGVKALVLDGIYRTVLFIAVAPILGMVGAYIFTIIIFVIVSRQRPSKVENFFKRAQLISAAFYSLSHGTNDAQKTMGIISALLFSSKLISHFYIPMWVILSCHGVIAMGTYFGGWRIVKTLGTRVKSLRPVDGFCAETSGGLILAITAHLGIPVSTTHVISGAIMGVGTVKGLSGVRWVVARNIFWAWILTIPFSAATAAGFYLIVKFLFKT